MGALGHVCRVVMTKNFRDGRWAYETSPGATRWYRKMTYRPRRVPEAQRERNDDTDRGGGGGGGCGGCGCGCGCSLGVRC
jgi:hypothetical protein